MESIKQYLIESYNELVTKVTWPNWEQLQSTSVVVIVASLILALLIFLMDLVSKGVLDGLIYNLNA
ncbi:MAG: preprotein translocase subunit SecE [Bacteroidetes bacterium]|nr:MAG: preprotein translocase subunit SecE [Bacteroidota bacterium]